MLNSFRTLQFILLSGIILNSVQAMTILNQPIPIPRNNGKGKESRVHPENVQFHMQNAEEGTYHFGYDIDQEDSKSFREEQRDARGKVWGRYGYLGPDGIFRVVEYEADHLGYRTRNVETTEPSAFRLDYSNLQLIGPIPKPVEFSYQLTRDDYE